METDSNSSENLPRIVHVARAMSFARTLAMIWGITAVVLAAALALMGSQDYLIVGEMIAASLTALGLRNKK